MEVILEIIILILSGYFLKVLNILKEEDSKVLSRVVIYLTMPSTIFLVILKNLNPCQISSFLKLMVIIILTFSLCGLLAYILGRFIKLDKKSLGGLILVCMLANTGFLGYPIILGMFGEHGLVRAIFCDMVSVFITMVLGSYVGIKFGSGEGKNVFVEMIKFPPLVTGVLSILLVIIGFKLSYLPNFILKSINYLSSATVPCIMISLGLSLSPRAIQYSLSISGLACLFRFLLSPTFAYLFSIIFGVYGLDRDVLIIESSMPSAMMSFVLGTIYNLNTKIISSAIFITTVMSFFVLFTLKFILV